MSALILTAATSLGSTLVRSAGQIALQFANSAISNAFDNRTFEGPRLDSFHVQTSRDGAPMPRHYGRSRMAGQVIWASQLTEIETEESAGGGKGGGPIIRNFSYTISFAIGLCEGEILSVERLWANGNPLEITGLNYRVYKGTQDQMPDPVMSAIDGPNIPAFRGTAYIVFEDFPLDGFGARLPQINAEVLRVPDQINRATQMENIVQGVNLLPSSGEFAYSPDVVEDVFLPGSARAVNVNNNSGQSDIKLALDQLSDQLPNCRSVSIIISWFGSDLRCAECRIRPGVELERRGIAGADWVVSATDRDEAYLVSRDAQGRPVFGGTPSDASIMGAIAELKSRGYAVTLYPFILMDINPAQNLPDPYGRTRQPDFPWRGRITSNFAPGQPQSADKTPAIDGQVAEFFGACQPSDFGTRNGLPDYDGPDEDSYRRFILHYAKLASMAGGVERFVIGSELRGLTTLRSGVDNNPAVDQLINLAADVRSLSGVGTQITYAADWSEYFGHQPQDGSGDVNFHLDPLWASSDIDAIGIDAYFPLSDWRAGEAHLDAQNYETIYEPEYLASQMEGGEGYNWFYASQSDREAQIRTPITDGAYDKPWVFRFKDVKNWWDNPHFNRTGGIEAAQPTAWQPRSKPIWFTEIGCPAIDKGANQPNVFVDPKSSESQRPYFSSGARDDLIQRRYIESFITYWNPQNGHNPVSDVYGGPMVDMQALHVWCWDARPFPALTQIWSDGQNWNLGHWLTGRSGLIPLTDIVYDLAIKSGARDVDTSRLTGIVQGYLLDRPMTTRAALQPLANVYGFNLVERASALSFISSFAEDRVTIASDDIAASNIGEIQYSKADSALRLKDVRLHFIDGARDFQLGSVSARDQAAETVRVLDINVPIVLGHGFAKSIAERVLRENLAGDQSVNFSLRGSDMKLEVGDIISLPNVTASAVDDTTGDKPLWQVTSIDGLQALSVEASRVVRQGGLAADAQQLGATGTGGLVSGLRLIQATQPIWFSAPDMLVLDIPHINGEAERQGPYLGANASPFSTVNISSQPGGVNTSRLTLSRSARTGYLTAPLARGPVGRFDRANHFDARFETGKFSSVTQDNLFSGANYFAVETPLGWEILQAQNIELIAPNTYRFSRLLRGQGGSEAEMVDIIAEGARCVALYTGLETYDIAHDFIDQIIFLNSQIARRNALPFDFTYRARQLRPLSPVHVKLAIGETSSNLSWIRRTRLGGDNWAALDVPLSETREFYRVQLFKDGDLLEGFETDTSRLELSGGAHTTLAMADYVTIAQGSELYGFGAEVRVDI